MRSLKIDGKLYRTIELCINSSIVIRDVQLYHSYSHSVMGGHYMLYVTARRHQWRQTIIGMRYTASSMTPSNKAVIPVRRHHMQRRVNGLSNMRPQHSIDEVTRSIFTAICKNRSILTRERYAVNWRQAQVKCTLSNDTTSSLTTDDIHTSRSSN